MNINWKPGDKCMAIWRVDGKYYSATIRQIFEDGSCTVVFDGQASIELSQVDYFIFYIRFIKITFLDRSVINTFKKCQYYFK